MTKKTIQQEASLKRSQKKYDELDKEFANNKSLSLAEESPRLKEIYAYGLCLIKTVSR